MAAQEIKSSRREWEDGRFKYGMMLHIGTAMSDAPVVGTTYFTPYGGSVESLLTGRICIHVNKDTEALPGIILFTSTYKQYKAYA